MPRSERARSATASPASRRGHAAEREATPQPKRSGQRLEEATSRYRPGRRIHETDAELVAGVRAGDRDAAACLADRYLRACRAVALSILDEVAAAEDVCQDAFVYSMERIGECRDPTRFGPWILQIVRNRSRNHRRDSKAPISTPIEVHQLASRELSPDRQVECREIREWLLRALRQLPEERVTVLLLHDLEGWTHREIAERLKLPPGTVRSHLHHARKRLRELLRELRE